MGMNAVIPTSGLEERARTQQAQIPGSETVTALRVGVK
jgi:hypothetical protein